MTWKIEKNESIDLQLNLNKFVFFAIFCRRQCVNILSIDFFFFFLEFAINQNASINKDSKNSNSKNLIQHTFAKSISFCCFCFYFAREIDRFIILICRYFSHQSKSKFSTRFSFSQISHIFFVFIFAFFAFAFIFSRLSHLFWIVLFLFWSNWYLSHNQRIS